MAHRLALVSLDDIARQRSLPRALWYADQTASFITPGMRHRIVTESPFATPKLSSGLVTAVLRVGVRLSSRHYRRPALFAPDVKRTPQSSHAAVELVC